MLTCLHNMKYHVIYCLIISQAEIAPPRRQLQEIMIRDIKCFSYLYKSNLGKETTDTLIKKKMQ